MAIQVKELKGTNSVSSDRITINDNFKINTFTINQLLGILNVTTGKFDNTGVGANSTITTEAITVTVGGIDISAGGLSITDGDIIIGGEGKSIRFGSTSFIKDTVLNSIHVLDFSEGFSGIAVPRLTTVQSATLGVELGATGPNVVLFDTDTNKFRGWDGTAFVDIS